MMRRFSSYQSGSIIKWPPVPEFSNSAFMDPNPEVKSITESDPDPEHW
jgi:hypothetical protein